MVDQNGFDRWRDFTMQALLCIVLAISVAEFSMYFFMEHSELMISSYWDYVIKYALIPTGLNLLTWGICILLLHHISLNEYWKDLLPLIAMMGICFWTSYFHEFFTASICSYVLVVVLSSILGDLAISRGTTIACMILTILSYMLPPIDTLAVSKLKIQDVVICLLLILISYWMTRIIVLYNQDREKALRKNYHRLEEMERKLLMDRMTGLYNHTGFYHILEDQMHECTVARQPLSLVVIDIDDFKKVNDTYGHENGNLVLKKLAELLKEACVPNAYACRYGGEEFALIFPGYSESQTKSVMERARIEFLRATYPFLEGGGISFSAGVRAYSKLMLSPQMFFENADKAMYYAKKSGKNQVYVILDETALRFQAQNWKEREEKWNQHLEEIVEKYGNEP